MNRKLLVAIAALLLLWSVPAAAQITIPFPTFTNGTTADADQITADYTALSSAALNRTGGAVTGAITVSAGVTIDGIDIGAVLGGTGTPTFTSVTTGTLTVSDTGASALDVAGGINAGTGNIGIVDSTGKIPALSSTFFANLSGVNLTNLTAANLTGTVATLNGGLGGNYSATAQGNIIIFNGAGTTAALAPGSAGQFLRTGGAGANPTWSTDGSNLTSLSASQLTSGTLGDARLSGTYSSALTFSSSSNAFRGAYQSTDGSSGVSGSCNLTAGLITVKNGLIMICP